MKKVFLAALVGSLTGCSAMESMKAEPPHYDYSRQALVGEGFPVEVIHTPPGFEFADVYQAERKQAHDRADDGVVARVQEGGAVWVSRQGGTVVATAMHQKASPGSAWLPWNEADGYEFAGGHRVQYGNYTGAYADVAGDAASIPQGAPGCAAASHFLLKSKDRSRRTVFTFVEGVPCDEVSALSRRDADDQRRRAYRAFGIAP